MSDLVTPRVHVQTRKAAGVESGGVDESVSRLRLDLVSPFSVPALSGKDGQAHLLAEGAADESAHAVSLPVGRCHDLLQGHAAFALHQFEDLSGLATLARRGRVLGHFGRLLRPAGLLSRRGFLGRNVGRLWRFLRVRGGFFLSRLGLRCNRGFSDRFGRRTFFGYGFSLGWGGKVQILNRFPVIGNNGPYLTALDQILLRIGLGKGGHNDERSGWRQSNGRDRDAHG